MSIPVIAFIAYKTRSLLKYPISSNNIEIFQESTGESVNGNGEYSGSKLARVSPERAEPASSTTGAPPPPAPGSAPADWSVEDVIGFIAAADQVLAAHADLFRRHVSANHTFLGFRTR